MGAKQTFVHRDFPAEDLPDEMRIHFPKGAKVRVTIETYADNSPPPSMRIYKIDANGLETEQVSDSALGLPE